MLTENMEWSKWIYHSPINSMFTGKQRNQLLMATIVERTLNTLSDEIYTQMSVLLNSGVFLTTKSNNKVITREFYTNTPETICNLIGLNIQDTYRYEDIYEIVKNEPNIIKKYEQYNRGNAS